MKLDFQHISATRLSVSTLITQEHKNGSAAAEGFRRCHPQIQSFGPGTPFFFCFCAKLVGSLEIEAAGHIPDSAQKTAQAPDKILIAGKSANQRVDVPIFQKLVLFRCFAPIWRARIGHRLSIRKPHKHTFRPGIRTLTGGAARSHRRTNMLFKKT